MRKLVRYHCRKLRLIVGGLDSPTVHEHVSARQRKCIDGLVIYAMKFERVLHALGRQLCSQPLAQLGQVRIYSRRIAGGQLFRRIYRHLLSERDIFLRRIKIPSRLELCPLRPSARRNQKTQRHEKCRSPNTQPRRTHIDNSTPSRPQKKKPRRKSSRAVSKSKTRSSLNAPSAASVQAQSPSTVLQRSCHSEPA